MRLFFLNELCPKRLRIGKSDFSILLFSDENIAAIADRFFPIACTAHLTPSGIFPISRIILARAFNPVESEQSIGFAFTNESAQMQERDNSSSYAIGERGLTVASIPRRLASHAATHR